MGASASDLNPTGRPLVVIVGGGYAGIHVAKGLDKSFFVVLIDRKDHLVHWLGLPRALSLPSSAPDMHIPYHRLLQHGVFLQAHVTSITPTAVHLHGLTQPITGFQYLVIATGSSYNLPSRIGPTLVQSKLPLVNEANAALHRARRVLIIGAGPVGVELAGEVATEFTGKEVTLVSAHDFLASPGMDAKFYAGVEGRLMGMGVKVIKSAKVTIPEAVSTQLAGQDELFLQGERQWELTNGERVEADLTFFSVGSVLNTSAIAAFKDVQAAHGDLRTDEFLRVNGHPQVFAVGDVNALEGRKLAFVAGEQGKWLGKHLAIIHRQGGGTQGLKAWKAPPPNTQILSLGRRNGIGAFDGSHLPTFLVKMLKSKDMMVGTSRKEMKVGKGERVRQWTEAEKAQRVDKLVAALKVSREDAARLSNGLPAPSIKELPARNHL